MKITQYFKTVLVTLCSPLLISNAMALSPPVSVDASVIKTWQAKPRFVQIQKEASQLVKKSRTANAAERAQLESRAQALLTELRGMGYEPAKKLRGEASSSRTAAPASAKGFGSLTPEGKKTALRTPVTLPPAHTRKPHSSGAFIGGSIAAKNNKQLAVMPKTHVPLNTVPQASRNAMTMAPATSRAASDKTAKMAVGASAMSQKPPEMPKNQRAAAPQVKTKVAKISPAMSGNAARAMSKGAIFRMNLSSPRQALFIGDKVTLNMNINNSGDTANKTSDNLTIHCASNKCPFSRASSSRINKAIGPGSSSSIPVSFDASKAGDFQIWVESKYGKSNKVRLSVKQKNVIRTIPRTRMP